MSYGRPDGEQITTNEGTFVQIGHRFQSARKKTFRNEKKLENMDKAKQIVCRTRITTKEGPICFHPLSNAAQPGRLSSEMLSGNRSDNNHDKICCVIHAIIAKFCENVLRRCLCEFPMYNHIAGHSSFVECPANNKEYEIVIVIMANTVV